MHPLYLWALHLELSICVGWVLGSTGRHFRFVQVTSGYIWRYSKEKGDHTQVVSVGLGDTTKSHFWFVLVSSLSASECSETHGGEDTHSGCVQPPCLSKLLLDATWSHWTEMEMASGQAKEEDERLVWSLEGRARPYFPPYEIKALCATTLFTPVFSLFHFCGYMCPRTDPLKIT